MSAIKKLRGDKGPVPPLRRLKQITIDRPEDGEWAFHLAGQKNPDTQQPLTNAECREEVRKRLGVALRSDSSYSDFRSWWLRQRLTERLNQIVEDDEQQLTDQFPGLSRDKIREAVIKRSYAAADLVNDPKFTLAVIKVDQKETTGRAKAELEKEKLQLARDAEKRQQEEHRLNREKFEFDAATAAKKFAAEIKTISANPRLNEGQKIDAIRQRLFGVLPPATSPTQ